MPRCTTTTTTISRGTRAQDLDSSSSSSRKQQTRNYFEEEVPRDRTDLDISEPTIVAIDGKLFHSIISNRRSRAAQ
uniref:BTB domain-containing protein n=1 Tax=Trichogramma kaykai TaxID=54128 RepID=A0ABD2VU97_9HYME